MVKNKYLSNSSIIPVPLRLKVKKGYFVLDSKTNIYCDLSFQNLGYYLRDLLKPATGFDLSIKLLTEMETRKNSITLKLNNGSKHIPTEGYKLMVTPDKIEIECRNSKGLFYGIQTLRQLFPSEIESSQQVSIDWNIPCVMIEDSPRFSWRGFMLDEARHFFGKQEVKKILDMMALLKFNTFHWHLTDNQGWRIEIKNFPLLIEIGSKRKSTRLFLNRRKSDGRPYMGYYSQEDLREIVAYAKERYIKVIPEIDIPGHISAALAAYPELACNRASFEVSTQIGILPEVLCVGKESVFNFIESIFKEIIDMFPSDLIHIGGDEVLTKRWKECELCQKRLITENLNSERELQTYFSNRISKFLENNGKRVIMWNDILDNNIKDSIIGQYWIEDINQVIEQIKNDRKMIMSEMESVYFDHGYNRTSLSKSYNYDPIPKLGGIKYDKDILGIEACLWTELILNDKDLEYKLFPRLIAISENAWSLKQNKDFLPFEARLTQFKKRMDYLNIRYAEQDEWF
ncbi:MAG: beta-N-acetylhexosaminidase [Promethearchaeota archaeon]